MLAKEQWKGAAILFGIALIGWFIAVIVSSDAPEQPDKPKKKSWEERKDSIRLADSLRYVQWAAEREQRYDSFRVADSLRRLERKTELKQLRDSARIADSLWRDSMGIFFAKQVKKDTIIDLNPCDTTDLLYIRGVGKYTAIQIIRYREQLGGYYSPFQLTEKPFTKCHLDTILYRFTADTTAIITIPVNSASIEILQRHPYIRYNQAKAIYNLRRKKLKLLSIDDLQDVPELTPKDLQQITPYLNFE